MVRSQNSFLILSALVLLAFPYANAEYYEEQVQPYPMPKYTPKPAAPMIMADVVVEGMVYCQNCKYSGTWSLTEAKPLAGTKVSVICRNYKGHIKFYKSFTTDDGGYFYAQLDKYHMRHHLLDHPLQSCVVKLVSSPDDDCNVFSNINYGMNGAVLRYENKRIKNKDYEAVIYAAGPLAFRPEHCAPREY